MTTKKEAHAGTAPLSAEGRRATSEPDIGHLDA
jgi:hypothetical protein